MDNQCSALSGSTRIDFFSPNVHRLRPIQPYIQWIWEGGGGDVLPPEVKQPKCDTYDVLPSSTELKNAWRLHLCFLYTFVVHWLDTRIISIWY
jgi:hypothetical protein